DERSLRGRVRVPGRLRRAAEAPGGEAGDERAEDEDPDERPEHAVPRAVRRGERLGHERRLLVVVRDPGVVLVDVEVAVQPEELGIRPQEALRVGLAREHLPALLLERRQVALADADALLDVRSGESAAGAGFAKAVTDGEHGGGSPKCEPKCGKTRSPGGEHVDIRWRTCKFL